MTITVDEYINSFYQQIQINLIKLRKIIKETSPEAQEKISWGVPTYFQDGFLVQFAAYKKLIWLYTSPQTIEAFKTELANYKTNNKNTVQFMFEQELPVELIKKMVLFKIEENTKWG